MRWTGVVSLLAAVLGCGPAAAAAQDNALHFDGVDDRVQLPVPAVLANSATQDFSVSTWLRRDAAGALTAQRVFYAQASPTNGVTLLLSGANMLLYVRPGDGSTISASAPLPPEAVWSHVTATWRAASATIEIYIDGEAVPLAPGGSTSTGADGLMTLGSRTDGAQPLQGALDDFRLWTVTLTPDHARVLARSTARWRRRSRRTTRSMSARRSGTTPAAWACPMSAASARRARC